MTLETEVARFELALLKDKRASQTSPPENRTGYYRDQRDIYKRLDDTITDLLINDSPPYGGTKEQQESLFAIYFTLLIKLISYSPDRDEYQRRIDFCEAKVLEYANSFASGHVAPTSLLIPRYKRFSLVHKLLRAGKHQN